MAKIDQGILAFIGVVKEDGILNSTRLAERILSYRIFADQVGKMNLSVGEIAGGVLLVPQFTLAADTSKGRRPSFTPAAPPEQAEQLFTHLLEHMQSIYQYVEKGVFAANMQVSLVNDGPVTFWLQA